MITITTAVQQFHGSLSKKKTAKKGETLDIRVQND